MAYPCDWPETFCLSALECMAAGAVPVTTDAFALRETVGQNGYLIKGVPSESHYDSEFVAKVTTLLNDDTVYREIKNRARAEIMKASRWSQIGTQWQGLVSELISLPTLC